MAVVLVLLGALAMVVATFLPLNESARFGRIEHNTLIQSGGWLLIVMALWAAVGAYRVDQGRQRPAFVIAPCVFGLALVGYWAVMAGSQTLYPVGADGQPDTSLPGVAATPGIGIYLAGVGVAAAGVGALMLRKQPAELDSPQA